MFKLLIEDDEGKTVVVPLIRDEITIGRKEGNTIRLSDQNVSRRHARLVHRDGVLTVEDLSSYNGTKLNGASLATLSPLKDGDLIIIGDYRMRINEDRAAKSAAPVAAASPHAAESPVAAAPPVADPMEGQPTIPVRSMPDLLMPGESPARLVVISRHMAGAEFVLDRPSLVIGRTPENDIVLDHKSISRHHAKLIREGSQHVLVDLESANGVRVDGMDRDRAILRSGDTIELGQMRLRFLAGGAVIEDEAPAGMGARRLIIGLAGAAVLAAVVVYLAVAGGSKPAPVEVAAVPASPPVQPAAVPEPPVPQPSFDESMALARAGQAAERWDEALANVVKAVAANPESAEAARLRQVVEAEKGNAERFAGLRQAAEANDLDALSRGAAEITQDSVYKERALALEKTTRTQFVAQHLEAASSALAEKDCEEAGPHIEQVLAAEPGNQKARGLSTKCLALTKAQARAEAVAARPRTVAAAKPAAPKPAAAPKAKAEPAEPAEAADPEQLIQQAREAWLRGQCSSAVESARKALRVKPGMASAHQIIAICSCSLKDADAAARAYEKLDDRNKQMVRSVCQKNGISL